MLNRIPCAPEMLISSSGLATAWRAASRARFSPRGSADAHQRRARVLHDRAHVGEVEVDQAGHRDDVADPRHALAQHVVDDPERVHDRGVLLDDVAQAVVGDRDQRVDLGLELLGGLLRDQLAPAALEAERLGHDADGERALLLGHLRDDGGRAGAGAAAEAGRDEHHVRVRERVRDLVAILLGGPLADRRVAAGAEALRDLVADADLVRRVGLEQRLGVRVAGDELDAHHLGADHPVHGVAAAAADADDADEGEVLGVGTQGHQRSPDVSSVATDDSTARRVGGVPVRAGLANGAAGLGAEYTHGMCVPVHGRRQAGRAAAPVGGARVHRGWVRFGGVRVGQPARKLSRTWRVALSALGSSSAIDCHVPSASRPARTGTVIDGAASSGSTWSAP